MIDALGRKDRVAGGGGHRGARLPNPCGLLGRPTRNRRRHRARSRAVVVRAGRRGPVHRFGPAGVDRFTAAVDRLAAAARTGSAPTNLEELPDFGAAELVTLRESLVPDAQ